MKYELDTWQNGSNRTGLSVPTAAGLLADGETLTVGVLAAEQGPGVNKGEPVPGLSMTLWENPLDGEDGEPPFMMRWTSGTTVAPGSAEAEVMHRVITRASAIAQRAEALQNETPWPDEQDGADATERVVTEVAVALGRQAELDPDPVVLTHDETLRLARHAMDRLCLIRDRDGIDPLPHAGVPVTNPRYDPLQHLVVIALAAARSPDGLPVPAALGLRSLKSVLDLDGAATLETWLAVIRAALEAGHADR